MTEPVVILPLEEYEQLKSGPTVSQLLSATHNYKEGCPLQLAAQKFRTALQLERLDEDGHVAYCLQLALITWRGEAMAQR